MKPPSFLFPPCNPLRNQLLGGETTVGLLAVKLPGWSSCNYLQKIYFVSTRRRCQCGSRWTSFWTPQIWGCQLCNLLAVFTRARVLSFQEPKFLPLWNGYSDTVSSPVLRSPLDTQVHVHEALAQCPAHKKWSIIVSHYYEDGMRFRGW